MQRLRMSDLRHRVKIRRAVLQTNDRGVETVAYPGTEDFKVWAHIESEGARTGKGEAEDTPEKEYTVTVRFRTDIGADDRVEHRGRLFEQTAPPENIDERRIFLRLRCREKVEA